MGGSIKIKIYWEKGITQNILGGQLEIQKVKHIKICKNNYKKILSKMLSSRQYTTKSKKTRKSIKHKNT